MNLKLCVFSNDPIISYFNKGEIKSRYFNPGNIFDEIHIITFIDDDIDSSKVKMLAGNATLKIYSMGNLNTLNLKNKKEKILDLVKEINPDVIRAYNSKLEGWLAAYCSKKLCKPFFVSIHAQYDGYRKLMRKKNFSKYLILQYSRKFIEPFVLKNADKITGVYKIIESYIYDIIKQQPEILYNKIELDRFKPKQKRIFNKKPIILSVSRLTSQKNHHIIIQAIKNLDVHLQIIGDGELLYPLQKLVKELSVENKVSFIKSVNNNEIQTYYQSADIFALAYDPKIEGVPIPVLEALASGMPIVIPEPEQGYSDGLEDAALFAKLESDSFKEQFIKIIDDEECREILCVNAIKKSRHFDTNNIENREKEIYQELIDTNNTRI
ncbi:UDP-D-galactose:(glucosyl)lipopolysaccharide-1,6-D-galactosyltransferase [Candidatus Nitrosomarinus catalina]|uniref:UDP-D-galactose:(Glucosyl)lipopolysaccharide-1, 6-D-galactosyltransferase n=1 Tax=Candidatus Nitrosomarinus catalinensis TaxID=1898749 RepID=A0A2Z2HLR1_9ARCH|nr:glycosyltransferase [Candidatus Nitrosomarinus catalina]ARS63766.1 UDP-D-galactose:(glucosyl)lipopolysaccharide-1,6-D-galactosyltransferase [Candidatus Nitrosomarinus catalina]